MTLPDDLQSNLLARWPVGRLATVSGAGDPHVVPVVFTPWRGALLIPVDGKRKRGSRLRRFANVAACPRASLLLDHYGDDWQTLWWVRIDGSAQRYLPPPDEGQAIVAALRDKYPQYARDTVAVDAAQWLKLYIGVVTTWTQAGGVGPIRESLERL
jgi:PPOX class probable F420-dependent enzyme